MSRTTAGLWERRVDGGSPVGGRHKFPLRAKAYRLIASARRAAGLRALEIGELNRMSWCELGRTLRVAEEGAGTGLVFEKDAR